MINILFISHSALLCGAERCLLDLIEGLDRAVYQPYVVVPHYAEDQAPLVGKLNSLGVITIKRTLSPWIAFSPAFNGKPLKVLLNLLTNGRQNIWAIYHLIKDLGIQVVYTNTITIIEGALAARMAKIPHIWHVHEAVKGNNSLTPALPSYLCAYIVAKLSARVIVPSRHLLQVAYPVNVLRKKAIVIHNGIDTNLFKQDVGVKNEVATKFGIPLDYKLVAIIGSIIPIKGHLDFLKAISLSNSRHSKTVFLIIGEGPKDYVKQVRDCAQALGLAKIVRFLGFLDPIHEILPGIDLLVLTSKSEAFPRTIIEAMASSVPVVATQCGGPGESVIDGATGYLVKIGSHEMIASAMDKVLFDRGLALKLGRAGRVRAELDFSIDSYISKIASVIQNAVIDRQ